MVCDATFSTIFGSGHFHTEQANKGRKTMRPRSMMIACTIVTAIAISAAGGLAAGEQREIVIGIECDRTGPTQIVGVNMCPGYQDYINLVNSRGGVEGYKIK